MRDPIRSHRVGCLALLLLAPMLALAVEPGSSTEAAPTPSTATSRFTLISSNTGVAPQQSDRYSLRARFAPVESAGELREGEHFTLIGRLAKGSVSCGAGTVFSNGFEGN